jgi:hypothetical protein
MVDKDPFLLIWIYLSIREKFYGEKIINTPTRFEFLSIFRMSEKVRK